MFQPPCLLHPHTKGPESNAKKARNQDRWKLKKNPPAYYVKVRLGIIVEDKMSAQTASSTIRNTLDYQRHKQRAQH